MDDSSINTGDVADAAPLNRNSDERPKLAPRGRPFTKGTVANPRGRPVGSLNKSTLLAQAYFDGVAKEITAKALTMAMAGDPVALRLCLERILPRRRDGAVRIDDFPELETAADCKAAVKAVIRAAAAGDISPGEAHAFIDLVEGQARVMAALIGEAKGQTPH